MAKGFLTPGNEAKDLRDLADKIRKVAMEHAAYSMVTTIIQNTEDHICAIARTIELRDELRLIKGE